MHHFTYKSGVLHAEDVCLAHVAEEVGTPFYCYLTATLERHYRCWPKPSPATDALICFAVKANSNQAVLATPAASAPAWTSSPRASWARGRPGVPADKIIFAGVGKTRARWPTRLSEGILGFNVESEPELEALSEVARRLGKTAPIASASIPTSMPTHAKISTGKAENKFGIPHLGCAAPLCPGAHAAGHRRSPASTCTSAARSPISCPFRDAFRLMRDLAYRPAPRMATSSRHLDIGGGLGVPYLGDNDVPPSRTPTRRW